MYSISDLQKLVQMLSFLGISPGSGAPAHSVVFGGGTYALPGASGSLLASNGASADPSFQTLAALGIQPAGTYAPLPLPANSVGSTQIAAGSVLDSAISSASKLYNRIHDFIDVRDFGATGNGSTDDTAAIQAALTAGGSGSTVYFPAGTYFVSSTLTGYTNQQIIGGGANSTILQRTGNYGDTLAISSAGAVRIAGLWFNHSSFYTPGQTSLPNLATGGAHVNLSGGQFAVIEDCFIWRLAYGIRLNGCSLTTIRKNWIQGVWDQVNAGCQEGTANILLDNALANCEIISIVENYLNGAKSASRNVTYTASDGTLTTPKSENIGSQFGVYVLGCEDLLLANNFIGANNQGGLYTNFNAGSTNLDWRIVGNFFDDPPTHNPSIYFNTQSAATLNGVTITGNVFNGEDVGFNAITEFNAFSANSPVINNFNITANTFQAHVGSPIQLYGASNGVISGNTITGYNALNVSAGADTTFSCAIQLAGGAAYVHVHGNNCGGAVNSGAPSGSHTYQNVSNGGINAGTNAVYGNLIVGGGPSNNLIGVAESQPTLISTPGNYQATSTDKTVIAVATQTGAWSFGLPTVAPAGREIVFKDGAGTAATFNVQVVGTVDGTVNPTYSTNFFTKRFLWNGVQWNDIGN